MNDLTSVCDRYRVGIGGAVAALAVRQKNGTVLACRKSDRIRDSKFRGKQVVDWLWLKDFLFGFVWRLSLLFGRIIAFLV